MEHLEGRQSILAALSAHQRKLQVILVSHGAHVEKFQDVLDLATARGIPIRHVDAKELDAMAHGVTHGGILAVASAKPRISVEDLLQLVDALTEPALLLLLEGVEDARNLGFAIRTAEAMGAHAVLIKKHLWDFDPVEVARPASGAYERLPLAQIEDVAPLEAMRRRGLHLFGCIAGARRTLYDVDLAQPAIIAIGGEKRGLSGAVRSICDTFISIPTRGVSTSLSGSHAGSVLLAEAMRQRILRGIPAPVSPMGSSGES